MTEAQLLRVAAQLTALAVALTGSIQSAEDLVQEAITRVYPKLSQIEPAGLYAYLRATIVNQQRDLVRRRHKAAQYSPPTTTAEPEAFDVGVRIDVRRALSVLRQDLRLIIVLRYLEDRTVADVAEMLQRPEGTIRRLTHQALRELRRTGVLDDYLINNSNRGSR
ncbi:MAG: RNA polymerase sigma factor [Nakamurella sp.]